MSLRNVRALRKTRPDCWMWNIESHNDEREDFDFHRNHIARVSCRCSSPTVKCRCSSPTVKEGFTPIRTLLDSRATATDSLPYATLRSDYFHSPVATWENNDR